LSLKATAAAPPNLINLEDIVSRRVQTIVHPTDFSDTSAVAFAHALRIALAMRGLLYLVHIAESESPDENDGFPHVRHMLARWRLMNESDQPEAVGKLGIKVAKIGLKPHDPLRALLHFLKEHPSDLIVLATHGRDGVAHWLHGSIAEELSRTAKLPTLFLPPTARGFVDQNTGKLYLSQVLVPVDHSPPPTEALGTIREFVNSMKEQDAKIELLHVGGSAPLIPCASGGAIIPVALRTGDVVSTILKAADEQQADLIAMPTAGHQGFLDAVRGSTSERVLRHAPCPVLAIPAGRPQADPRRAAGTDHQVAQALEILGLKAGATDQEIRAAYIRLMQRVHPDKGGTNFFAKQLTDARDVLLGHRAR
jgi:nucleotide-binding universal stress UspA family protein